MITTNLTLTNGATSDVPMLVEGITFGVDSKLAVNPSVTFPLTVAIDSSEVVGIDFDNTLHTGNYQEEITINTLGGRNDIVHTVRTTFVCDDGIVTNGCFDYDLSGWSADSAWLWDDGRAHFNGDGYLDMHQTLTPSVGTNLLITCDLEFISGGEARVYYDGVELYNENTAGLHHLSFEIVNAQSGNLQFTVASDGGEYYVDNVKVEEIPLSSMIRDGDFALGTADEWDDESGGSGTTFDTNQAVIASDVGYSQNLMQHDIGVSAVAGVQYQIDFDITNFISGEIGMCLGIWASVDTGAEYLSGDQHVSTIHTTKDGNTDGFMVFAGAAGAHMTIDNITVKEL